MIELKDYKRYFPTFTPPTDKSPEEYFDELVEKGAAIRYGEIDKELRDRIEDEKRVYKKLDFCNAVLVIADLINGLKAEGIGFDMAGLQCGSIVNYALGITEIDPIKHGFLFENYINEKDENTGKGFTYYYPFYCIDACSENMGKITTYFARKYGENSLIKLPQDGDYYTNYIFGTNLEGLDIFGKSGNRQCAISAFDASASGLFVLYTHSDKLLNILADCKRNIKEELKFDMDGCFDQKTWECLSSGKFINPEFKKRDKKSDPVIDMIFQNRYRADLRNLEDLSGFLSIGGFDRLLPSERNIKNFCEYKSIIPQEKVLFEEDCIRLIRKMTGQSMADSEIVFRRIRRGNSEIKSVKKDFIVDSVKNGVKQEYAEEIFDELKSKIRHNRYIVKTKTWAYFYAYRLYMLAYISAHYPEEYNQTVAKYEKA